MNKVALFAATDLEYRAFVSILERWHPNSTFPAGGTGWHGENCIEIFRTETGPQSAAEQAAKALSSTDADMVLVSGLAGGLSPECRNGDMVLYRGCRFAENMESAGETIGCDSALTDQLLDRLRVSQIRVHEGTGLTAPRIICSVSEKEQTGLRYKAIAVDMESYQILSVAGESGRPAAVLRVISDDLRHDLPDLNAGLDSQARVSKIKMMLSLSAHPLLAARFLVNIRRAMKQLKLALRSILEAPLREPSRL